MPNLLSDAKPKKALKLYRPSDTEDDIISGIWHKWEMAREMRHNRYRFFNDRSLAEYVEDSVDRFNGYIEPRTDPAADWGAHVFHPATRNKTIAIIAQITAERVRAEFFAQLDGDDDEHRAATLIKHLEDYTYYKNRDDEQQFYAVVEAAVKGTVIGYEGYKRDTRKIKEITEYDADTGEIKFEEKEIEDYDDVFGEVIPLMDIYPANIYVRDIQKQPYMIWRTVIDHEMFLAEFGKYKNAKLVQPSAELRRDSQNVAGDDENRASISEDVLDNQVEIIRYFDRPNDEFHIIANGVLLTPTESPLPWDHKNYPFWKAMFEPFDNAFFYGKSLPDKLRDNQDILNTLYRLVIDQGILSVNPPILTQGMEEIRDEMLFPGRRVPVDDVTQTKIMEIPTPGAAHFNIMQMVETNINKSSMDDPSSGSATSRTTAFEIGVAKEAAQKLLSLFLRSLEWGVRDKTELRIANILQFYRLPKIQSLSDDEAENTYRTIFLEDTRLADGTKGRQSIQVVDGELPTEAEVNRRELSGLMQGKNIGLAYITTEFLRTIDIRIKIIPNSSLKMSEALERALELDYQQKVNALYPDLLNREEAFKELNKAYDKDSTKLMVNAPSQGPSSLEQIMGPQGADAGAAAGPSAGTVNSANQAGIPQANETLNSLRNIPAG
jgi:hypothetical protein